MNLTAQGRVPCDGGLHRVGVTARGQVVMADHDRRLERLAVSLEREAELPCARAYHALRAALAEGRTDSDLGQSLNDYLTDTAQIRATRHDRRAHTLRLVQISVLGGMPGPALPEDYRARPDSVVRQSLYRARQGALERLLPELFLRACRYPIVARHPPAGPGVARGACWHVTLADLTPEDDFPLVTRPHPWIRGRVCHSLIVPLSRTWYRDVYKAGLAVLDGELVVSRVDPPPAGVWRAEVLRQRGARFSLVEVEVVPDGAGWRRSDMSPASRAGAAPAGTGVRPSPWD